MQFTGLTGFLRIDRIRAEATKAIHRINRIKAEAKAWLSTRGACCSLMSASVDLVLENPVNPEKSC
jgi:hypothetical protein